MELVVRKLQAVIVCVEKIVSIPGRNKPLILHGDGSTQGSVTSLLHIISCTKAHKYMEKGYPIFLAHITAKEVEDKLEKKRLEDVPIVQDFPEVFPEDLPGLPPTRQVEFQIDLVPGAAPIGHPPKSPTEDSVNFSLAGYYHKKEAAFQTVDAKPGAVHQILALPGKEARFHAFCELQRRESYVVDDALIRKERGTAFKTFEP
ncbi:hypothetical protein Tco_0561641 [Tanacetum coccineum]